eukprot:364896-Chlamydomonas_euryale.AAC.2
MSKVCSPRDAARGVWMEVERWVGLARGWRGAGCPSPFFLGRGAERGDARVVSRHACLQLCLQMPTRLSGMQPRMWSKAWPCRKARMQQLAELARVSQPAALRCPNRQKRMPCSIIPLRWWWAPMHAGAQGAGRRALSGLVDQTGACLPCGCAHAPSAMSFRAFVRHSAHAVKLRVL